MCRINHRSLLLFSWGCDDVSSDPAHCGYTGKTLKISIPDTSCKAGLPIGGSLPLSALMLVAVFVFLLSFNPASADPEGPAVYVNGRATLMKTVRIEGTVFAPAHALAQALGITISWNPGAEELKINGKQTISSAKTLDGRLYLPVEALCRFAGAVVEWDGKNDKIRISMKTAEIAKPTDTAFPDYVASMPEKKPVKSGSFEDSGDSDFHVPLPKPGMSTINDAQATTATDKKASEKPSPNNITTDGNLSMDLPVDFPAQLPGNPRPTGDLKNPTTPPKFESTQEKKAPVKTPVYEPVASKPPSTDSLVVSDVPTSQNVRKSSSITFIPRSMSNGVFRITVTNMEVVESIKNYYKPRSGCKFVVVYVSQENISEDIQIYTGKLSLVDSGRNSYNYVENLSNFWLVVLKPEGINFGYLVFEIPNSVIPTTLRLEGVDQPPINVSLK